MFLALFAKNDMFAYLTLKMTLRHKNITRNGLPILLETSHIV